MIAAAVVASVVVTTPSDPVAQSSAAPSPAASPPAPAPSTPTQQANPRKLARVSPTPQQTESTPEAPRRVTPRSPLHKPAPQVPANPRPEVDSPVAGAPQPGAPGGSQPTTPSPTPDLELPALLERIVLGDTRDENGVSHSLVLNVSRSAAQAVVGSENVFAVISGASKFSVAGDAAVDSWRFTVNPTATGTQAPIIIVKSTTARSLLELAPHPSTYAAVTELNEDAVAASTRLSALIADVMIKAGSAQAGAALYEALAQKLTQPDWTGVLIFNANVRVPDDVLGQAPGVLTDSTVNATAIGFDAVAVAGAAADSRPFFGTIDLAETAGDDLPAGMQYLRARFANSALTLLEHG